MSVSYRANQDERNNKRHAFKERIGKAVEIIPSMVVIAAIQTDDRLTGGN